MTGATAGASSPGAYAKRLDQAVEIADPGVADGLAVAGDGRHGRAVARPDDDVRAVLAAAERLLAEEFAGPGGAVAAGREDARRTRGVAGAAEGIPARDRRRSAAAQRVRIDRVELPLRDRGQRIVRVHEHDDRVMRDDDAASARSRNAGGIARLRRRSSAGSSRRCRRRLRAARSARWPSPASAAGSSTPGMARAECIAPAQHERAQRVRADHRQRAGERISARHRRDESARAAKRRSHERAPPAPARATQEPMPRAHHVISASTCGSSSRSGPNTHENALPTPSSLRDLEPRLMQLQHVLDDREAKAGAAGLARAAGRHAVEALGQARQVLRRNALAGVDHRQTSAVAHRFPSAA